MIPRNLSEVIQKANKIKSIYNDGGSLSLARQVVVRLELVRYQAFFQRHLGHTHTLRKLNDWIYQQWLQQLHQQEQTATQWLDAMNSWQVRPTFEVLICHRPSAPLKNTINSLQNQHWPHWRMHLLMAPNSRELEVLQSVNIPKTRLHHQLLGESLTKILNRLLPTLNGDFVVVLFAGDQLHQAALASIAARMQIKELDLVYTDHDHLDDQGQRHSPCFKPDWSPFRHLGHHYLLNLTAIRTELIGQCGGFDNGHYSWLYDLILRVSELSQPQRIDHVPELLFHHYRPRGFREDPTDVIYGAQPIAAALEALPCAREAVKRRGFRAQVCYENRHQWVSVIPLVETEPLISILIPFRDQWPLLRQCLDSILETTSYSHFEIVLVDNQSQPDTLKALEQFSQQGYPIRLLHYPKAFNYAAINNMAVEHANGQHVVLLNNDTTVITPDWLRWLLAFSHRPEVGAVGAKLLYPNGLLQHCGVVTGLLGVAGHKQRFAQADQAGDLLNLQVTHEVSAVTAACLMVKRDLYLEVGGMDETQFRVAFNDVDFCLKLRQAGYWNLVVPRVQLIHHESYSRGKDDSPEKLRLVLKEISNLNDKWGETLAQDPFYNPNLALDAEDGFLRFKK